MRGWLGKQNPVVAILGAITLLDMVGVLDRFADVGLRDRLWMVYTVAVIGWYGGTWWTDMLFRLSNRHEAGELYGEREEPGETMPDPSPTEQA